MATKRKDGRYQSSVTVTNPFTGKKTRKYVYAYTLEELNKEKKRLLSDVENILTATSDLKLSTYADEILKRKKEEGLSPVSIYMYENDIKKYIKPFLGHLSLNKITPLVIRSSFLPNITSNTVKKRAFSLLRMILNQAYYDELIDKNPCERIKLKPEPSKEKAIITNEIYSKLLSITAGTSTHELYILAYETGMRRAELSALIWKQLPFLFNPNEIPAIYVDRAMKYVNREKIIGSTKTNTGHRQILLSNAAIKALKCQLKRQQDLAMRNNISFKQTDYVFTTSTYCSLTPASITSNFCRNKHRAKIINQNISFHSFRHTHATLLMQNGLSEKAIAERLGHKSFVFTFNRYTHSTKEAQEKIVDFLNKKPV